MFGFNPPTIALLELAERWLEDPSLEADLLLVLKNVTNLSQAEHNGFMFNAQGIKKTNSLLNKIEDINKAYTERAEHLESLEGIIRRKESQKIEEILNKIEETTIIIEQASSIATAEDSKMRLSRYPVLNNFLQACMNVYGESEPIEVLQPRIAAAINFVTSMEEQFKAHLEIRPQAAPWQPHFTDEIEKIKEGIGAVQIYIEERNSQNLIAGSHLIQENSLALFNLLQDMYEKTGGLHTFSKVSELERLWIRRFRFKEGTITKEALDQAMNDVSMLISFHESSYANFIESPVNEAIKNHYQSSIEALIKYERESFEKLTDDDTTLVMLKEAIEKYIETISTISEYITQTIPNISEATNINELCKVILGVYNGVTPVRILRRIMQYLKESLEKDSSQDDGAGNALELQKQGLELIEEFLSVRNREILAKALEVLQNGTILLLDYYKEKSKSVIDNDDEEKIACMKCGYSNKKGISHCESCHSYLLFAKNMMASENHLINYENGELSDVEKPENIKKLEELASTISYSQDPVDVKEIVAPILAQANEVLEFFQKRPAEAAEKDEMNPEKFIEATKLYKSGLEKFLEYDKDGDKAHIATGIDMIRKASDQFIQIKTSSVPA